MDYRTLVKLKDSLRLWRDYLLVLFSGYFDKKWYLQTYPDVKNARVDPLLHFLRHGGAEGRDPGPYFSNRAYTAHRSYVDLSNLNPLVHYLLHRADPALHDDPLNVVHLSDIELTKKYYRLIFNCELDLEHPRTFTEKISAYKLFYRDQPLWKYVDKYAVSDFVSEKIGSRYLVPLLGVYDRAEDIDFAGLPEKFVIKATHGSNWNMICTDKSHFNIPECIQNYSTFLRINYYAHWREWAYKNVPPRIIIQELLLAEDGSLAKDYQFLCFNGVPKYLHVVGNRFNDTHTLQYFDTNWKKLKIVTVTPPPQVDEEKPPNFDEMLDVATRLSTGFPFVRVDLFSQPRVLFGELTFYPRAGLSPYRQPATDRRFGRDFSTTPFSTTGKYRKD